MDCPVDGDIGMRYAEFTPDEIRSMRKFPNPTNDGEDVLANELDIPSDICLTLVRDNIMLRCTGSRFTTDEKKFLYSLMNEIYINVDKLILSKL